MPSIHFLYRLALSLSQPNKERYIQQQTMNDSSRPITYLAKSKACNTFKRIPPSFAQASKASALEA